MVEWDSLLPGESKVNFKLLLPTYRTRYRFVKEVLASMASSGRSRRMLHLGSGEGELDAMLARFTDRLDACDVNDRDVSYARKLNLETPQLRYSVEHAEKLGYRDESFDTVVCLEVIEHVENPQAVLAEVRRVLRPGGQAIFTFPSHSFPFVYDPINHLLQRATRTLPIGAYAYGHRWLVQANEMDSWLGAQGFRVRRRELLSRHLVAFVECYLPGFLQRIFKANATNDAGGTHEGLALRPGTSEPSGVRIIDGLIRLDAWLFPNARRSVGLAYVVEREAS